MKDDRPLLKRLHLLRRGSLSNVELAQTAVDIAHSDFLNHDDVIRDLVGLLRHSDPDVRQEVISALAYHGLRFEWEQEPGKTLRGDLLEAVHYDPDDDCRRGAASALGSLFKGSRDQGVMLALREVCGKESEAQHIRAFAYTSFLSIWGVPVQQQPNPVNLKVGHAELENMDRYLRDVANGS